MICIYYCRFDIPPFQLFSFHAGCLLDSQLKRWLDKLQLKCMKAGAQLFSFHAGCLLNSQLKRWLDKLQLRCMKAGANMRARPAHELSIAAIEKPKEEACLNLVRL